jgi:hypothetical protein
MCLLIFAFFLGSAPAQTNQVQESAVSAGTAAPSDTAEAGASAEAPSGPALFSLLPLIEAACNGELRWRPDWPGHFPPDAFILSGETSAAPRRSVIMVLDDGDEPYRFSRDRSGRLEEFPFFAPNAVLRVSAGYGPSGGIARMSVGVTAPAAVSEAAGDESPETRWEIEFPPDFFPYGGASPGGVFPPLRVSQGEDFFFVFLFESPVFLSETWYDGEGELLAHFKAAVYRENGFWRIRSLQTWDGQGPRVADYFFDSGGNITGVRSPEGDFQALYRDGRPRYWERRPADSDSGETESSVRYSLQWDEPGLLRVLKTESPAGEEAPAEYRYEYRRDDAGNWVSRQDIAIINRFGVFAPRPDRAWTRRISFVEE